MEDGTELLTAEIDTAVFSERRWYVAGFGRFWFTSKEDAEAAIGLARAAAANASKVAAHKISNALSEFL